MNRNSTAMKIKSIFYILLASIAMLSITSCDTLSQNGDVVVAEDVRFILKEDAIDLTTANIRVRHTGSSDVMWVFMQTQDLDTPADELIEARVKNEYAYTNSIIARTGSNISLPFSGLEVKNYYRIIVKAINRDGNLYGEAASLIFKTKRNPNSWEVNENWNLEYVSRTPGYRDGADVDLENFQCTSSDSESYILLSLSKEDWEAYEKNPAHNDKIRTVFEDYHKDFVSRKDYKKNVFKGSAKWQEERFRSGDYVVFMIGLDEENELSGLYRQFSIRIDPEEASEAYNKWLGVWEVSFPGRDTDPWTIIIRDLDPNMWYVSYGWEPDAISSPVYQYPLKLYYDRFTNKLYLVSQEVGEGANNEKLYYYGTFLYRSSQIVLDYDNVRVAEITPTNTAKTEADISPLGMTLAGVGDIEFSYSLFYIRYSSSSAMAASGSIPNYPWAMKRVGGLDSL